MGRKRARPRESNSPDPDRPPLRRSARLAGFAARREALERLNPASPQHVRPPPRRVSFAMQLAIEPPERVTVGVPFGVPIVITFTATEQKDGEMRMSPVSELSGVWAYLSLMTEDQSQSLAPPNTDLLQGRVADSIHPIMRQPAGEVQTIGYAKFPDLVITEPGRYCFRVTVIEMNNMMVPDPSEGGTVLPSVHSAPFDVVIQAAEDVVYLEKYTETMAQLREIGVNV